MAQDESILGIQIFLSDSQWMTRAELDEFQLHRLKLILKHAYETCPGYRELWPILPEEITWEYFYSLPTIDKKFVQENWKSLVSSNVPPETGQIHEFRSSGSTGTHTKTLATDSDSIIDECLYDRFDKWVGVKGRTGLIRPTDAGFELFFSSSNPVEKQVEWLIKNKIEILCTMPTNLKAISEFVIREKVKMDLLTVITFGEVLSDETKKYVQKAFGNEMKVWDIYSSEELKFVAGICEHGTYHVNDEVICIELLDPNNDQVEVGETGAIVATTLHNLVMPLIRYKNGDYATKNDACPCGRGLTPIGKIFGRERNMLTLNNGDKIWPSFPIEDWVILGERLKRFQLIQENLSEITIRLEVDGEILIEEEQEIADMLNQKFGQTFDYTFKYENVIPMSNGKFEDFISNIPFTSQEYTLSGSIPIPDQTPIWKIPFAPPIIRPKYTKIVT